MAAKQTHSKGRKTSNSKKSYSFFKDTFNLGIAGVLLVITSIAFAPSLQNEFVNYDDDKNFIDFDPVRNSTDFSSLIKNTPEIFSTTVIGNYNPLSNFTFAVENVVFGMDKPFYWHLDNLLLHLLCTFLIFRIALALGLNSWGAALCALLFGIHPMRVESVAWVTERKDVLFGSFFLLAIYYYIKGLKINNPNKYLLVIIPLFLLSGLSKIQAVTLPLSFIAVDFLMGEKLSLRMITSKWFYFLISLAIGILGILFLQEQGSLDQSTDFSFFERLAIGAYSYCVYLIKFIYPYQLAPLYPYPKTLNYLFYLAFIPVFSIIGLLVWSIKKNREVIIFGILFFTFNIMFLLQIVGAGQGFKADRFTYIAYFGLFYLLAFYFEKWIKSEKLKIPIIIAFSVWIIFLGYTTFEQTKIWKNSGTMWTHVLNYYPNTVLPWNNRGNYYRDVGNNSAALYDFSQAINLAPDRPGAYNSRGKLYFQSRDRDSIQLAIQDYTKAIELDPANDEYYMNRGATYSKLGNFYTSIQDLTTAINMNPNNLTALANRSVVYHFVKQYEKEIEDLNSYLSINPNNGHMWANRGTAFLALGNYEQAITDINQAIRINPNFAAYYYYKAQYYYLTGDLTNAQVELNNAIQRGYRFNGTLDDLAKLQ